MDRLSFVAPMRHRKSTCIQSGFTLIELLTVITIVGVLSIGLLTVVNPLDQIAKSRDARRKADLAAVSKALELYYQDHGSYPQAYQGKIVDDTTGQPLTWGQASFTPYMQRLPQDANTSNTYAYKTTGQAYWLFTSLDRKGKDPQACSKTDTTACGQATGVTCGSGVCNFGVTSPNVSVN